MTSQIQALPHIVEQLVDDCAFLWQQRLQLVVAADADLTMLQAHEQRLNHYLHALLCQGQAAIEMSLALLDFETEGEFFVAAFTALHLHDIGALKTIIERSTGNLALQQSIAQALAWRPCGAAQQQISQLLQAGLTERCIAVAAIIAIPDNPGQHVSQLLQTAETGWQTVLIKHHPQIPMLTDSELSALLAADAAGLRFAACTALFASHKLSADNQALAILDALACNEDNKDWQSALAIRLIVSDPAANRQWLAQQQAQQSKRWLATAMGLCGDATMIEPLLELLTQPECHKLAGEALQLITGIDWGARNLLFEGEPTAFDNDPEPVPDRDLPWLNITAVKDYCQQLSLPHGKRLLLGKLADPEQIYHVLCQGLQRQRQLALYLLRDQTGSGDTALDLYWPAKQQQAWLARQADKLAITGG